LTGGSCHQDVAILSTFSTPLRNDTPSSLGGNSFFFLFETGIPVSVFTTTKVLGGTGSSHQQVARFVDIILSENAFTLNTLGGVSQ